MGAGRRARRWSRAARDCRGQTIVELAVVLPVVLLMLFGMVEFGRAYHAYVTVQHATREGARLGITGASDEAIRQRILDTSAGLDPARFEISISPARAERVKGSSLTVAVRYLFPLWIPLITALVGDGIPLEAELIMRVEG